MCAVKRREKKKALENLCHRGALRLKSIQTREHFTALEDSMFSVNSDSVFANDFRFTYFHKTQIPAILKQITKYLGKRSNILTLFPQFMLEDSDIETMAFIEHTLFGDNRLMPNIQNFIYV